MSKCWYCNEELTTANYSDKHIGICTRCYNSMFKFSDVFVKGLTDKIADLELKLADMSKKYELASLPMGGLVDTARNLEQQLAEKDKEIARLKLLVDGFDKLKQYDKDADLILINPKTCYTDGKELVIKSDNQDKINFAVEQLEKVKELCKKKFDWWENSEWEGDIYDKSDVSNAYFDIEANIDNQIKQLKEME